MSSAIFAPRLPISVIIAMYNTEKYIGECLESLLVQTFQDFEVILIDDCSTDNGNAVARNYEKKFNGRLKIVRLKKNSGNNGIPNNMGLALSRGEYVLFMDSDDTVTPDALEKLYNVAKNFDADVVTCEKFYNVPEESWDDLEFRKNLKPFTYKKGELVTEPTLITDDIAERVKKCAQTQFIWNIWSKLIRRDFLVDNEITITNEMANDMMLTLFLIYSVKRFVIVPYTINFYRVLSTSLTHQKRDPLKQLRKYLRALTVGIRHLNSFLSKREFFQENTECKHTALNTYVREIYDGYIKKIYDKVPARDREEALVQEFSFDDNSALTAFLFNGLADFIKKREDDIRKMTARVDIQLRPKIADGDFKIVSVSDDKATVWKPDWFNKDGTGYQVQSYNGNMEIVAKAMTDGQIRIWLKGVDILDPKDNSKRIPYWIDYTKLTVNGKKIFDKLTPAWHDKFYLYSLNVKAGEEIKVQVEWIPHIGNVSEVATTKIKPIADKFLPYITARLDVKLMTTAGGDFQIVSVSDDKAVIRKSAWLKGNDTGYFIESYDGKLKLVTKAFGNGRFNLGLRGRNVPDPNDKSKRIPYWIDYTKLIVNGKVIFDKTTPTWHDKAYYYNLDVKAGEEIVVQAEWLPHKGDTPAASPVVAPKPIPPGTDAEIINRFKRWFSARLDLQMMTTNKNDLQIVSISDDRADVRKPGWFNRDGVGYVIQSHAGKLDIVFKVIEGGLINMVLKGLFYANPKDKSKHIPYWVDYTKFIVNDEVVLNKLTPVWHDKPYNYTWEAKAGEEIKLHVEWLPHRSDT